MGQVAPVKSRTADISRRLLAMGGGTKCAWMYDGTAGHIIPAPAVQSYAWRMCIYGERAPDRIRWNTLVIGRQFSLFACSCYLAVHL